MMGLFWVLNICYKTRQVRLCKSSNRNVVGSKNLGTETPKYFRVRGAMTTESEQIFELDIHRFRGTNK